MMKDVRQIQEQMKQFQDYQKSYSNKNRKNLEFVIGDKVFVKVASYKHIMRIGR